MKPNPGVKKLMPGIQVYLPKNEREKQPELSASSMSLNDRVERLSKFKQEKKVEWKQKLGEIDKKKPESSSSGLLVEHSPPTKGPKSNTRSAALDKESVRMSKQLGREVASAMKNMSKVMEHAFKPIYD
jgi:cell pole-organizing protein PopZ